MINFVMVLSELWLYVLDIWVKSRVGLSADHHLNQVAGEAAGQTWKTQISSTGELVE